MAEQFTEKDVIIKDIICKLDDGKLKAGDRLPTESELAAQYGISKTNIHLGIQQLERLGFVRVVPRHAIYVNPPEMLTLEAIDALFKYLDHIPGRPVVEALLEMRRMMGMSMIHGLSTHQESEKVQQLTLLLDQLSAAVDTGDADVREQALLKLLSFLYRSSGNELFPLLIRSLHTAMTQAAHYISLYADSREMVSVYRSMKEYILQNNQEAAVKVWADWNERMTQTFLRGLYRDK